MALNRYIGMMFEDYIDAALSEDGDLWCLHCEDRKLQLDKISPVTSPRGDEGNVLSFTCEGCGTGYALIARWGKQSDEA